MSRADASVVPPERLQGVDAGRFVGFVLVCAIHTVELGAADPYADGAGGWIRLAARCAVPFFLLASGGFASARPWRGWAAELRARAPLVVAYLAWVALYVVGTGSLSSLSRSTTLVWTLWQGGPGYHLWFLPALAFALVVQARLSGRKRATLGVAGAAGLAAWLLSTWSPAPYSVAVARWAAAVALVLAGGLLIGVRWRGVALGAALLLGGYALAVVEARAVSGLRLHPPGDLEFPLGAFVMGAGAYLLALRWRPKGRVLATLGREGFGLYAAHLGVALFLYAALRPSDLQGRLGLWLLTAAFTLPPVMALAHARWAPLRRLVRPTSRVPGSGPPS